MGLGKSKMVLDKFCCHFIEGRINSILIVCPYNVRFSWREQLEIHCSVEYEVAVAGAKDAASRGKAEHIIHIKSNKLKILIVGIESLQLQSTKALEQCKDFIEANKVATVVDESHGIKNPDASRTKNLIKITELDKTVYRVVMTGTPVSQSIIDLYGH